MFVKMVYDTPLMTVREVQQAQRPEEKAVHVLYTDKNSFKSHAKALGLMDDLKVSISDTMTQVMLLFDKNISFSYINIFINKIRKVWHILAK